MIAATVLIPTHDHGITLRSSVASVLRQTVTSLEVFVVGDGVPDETRKLMREVTALDQRVRFFDNPKGPRHGEIWRNKALAHAQGRIVCYLSDDDLYLPNHVETMSGLLEHADFAHAFAVQVRTDGAFASWTVDLSDPVYRDELLAGRNHVPLSAGGHTLDAYQRLENGWSTTPDGIPTDLYMWQRFLRQEGCRFVAGQTLTVLNFPARDRLGQSMAARAEELETWLSRIADGEVANWNEKLLAQKIDEAARLESRVIVASNGSAQPRFGTVQVFHPTAGGYSEASCSSFLVPFGKWQTITLTTTNSESGGRLRIDPASSPCLIQLGEISLRTPDGAILWQLLPGMQHEVNVIGASALVCRDGIMGILNEIDDPQVILPPVAYPSTATLVIRVKLDNDAVATDVISLCLNLLKIRSQAAMMHPGG